MCKELSAVFTYSEASGLQMFRSPETDAHQDILELHSFTSGEENTACVEYVCQDYSKAYEADQWILTLDDDRAPSWWQEQKHAVEVKMAKLVENLTIRENKKILVGGGPYILAPEVKVEKMVRCRVLTMCEGAMCGDGSTVTGGNDSTVTGGYYSIVTGGTNSKVTGGYASTVTGGNASTVTGGNDSTVTGGNDSTVTGGTNSKVTGGNRSTVTGGYASTVTGGNDSTVTGGYASTVTGGYDSTVTGGNRSAATGGNGSTLRIDHGDHMHECKVGENGILANHAYKITDEKWVLA